VRRYGVFVCVAAILAASTQFGALPAAAQGRIALVIGNGAYRHVAELKNPPNDAHDIGVALSRLGFSVRKIDDADLNHMRGALADLANSAKLAEIAVVFFAGHGMEVAGENWLIPTDARLASDTDSEKETVNLRSVLASIEGATKLGLVILDACRDNPFAAKMTRTIQSRRVDRGLVRYEPFGDVVIAYAAKDGSTAADGTGRNSPFTNALLKHLETPGLEINFLFRRVRDDVLASTQRAQFPYVYGSLSQNEIFLKSASAAIAAQPRTPGAGDYPNRPVTLMVPFAAGGPTDVMARRIAEALGRELGQPVQVANKLGRNGIDGTLVVAAAAPDGYTLLLGDTVTHAIEPSLARAVGYDPHNDFEPVGLLGSAQLALLVRRSLPADSVPELIAALRREPQLATYATGGSGTLSHLVPEHLASAAGVKLRGIAFRGEAPAMQGVLAGDASLYVGPLVIAQPQVARGTMRAIAVTGSKRSSAFPDVPTVAEALPGFEAVRNYGLLAPAGTPRPILDRLNAALRAALAQSDMRAKLAPFGIEPAVTTPDAHASMIDREIAKWTRIMWRAGIDPNQ
jgi:tripartite-type tricarboxylate transporter receptor subunit TctC